VLYSMRAIPASTRLDRYSRRLHIDDELMEELVTNQKRNASGWKFFSLRMR